MKCAVCGRDSKYSICGRCLAKRERIISYPEVVEIILCPRCGRFKFSGSWKELSFDDALDKAIENSFFVHPELEVKEFDLSGDGHFYSFKIKGVLRGDYVEEEGFFKVRVKREGCQKCSREAGGYYEAIIQLRAKNRKILDEEVERVAKIVEEEIESSGSEKSFLTKIVERREGIDFYIGDSKVAKKIAKRVVKEFGAEFKESAKIAGRKDGVELYRMTYLVRLPEHFPGDVVVAKGRIAVAKVNKAYDLLTGSTIPLEGVKVIVRREELKSGYVINKDDSALEIFSEDRVYIAEKPEYNVNVGEEVFLAVIEDKAYAIPKWMIE